MSFNGVNIDDWALDEVISAGYGCQILYVTHSAIYNGNPLTGAVHGTKGITFGNSPPDHRSLMFFTYEDPRSPVHRFNGNTDQSIWCCWRQHTSFGHPGNPTIDIGLRYAGDKTNGYFLSADENGIFLSSQNSPTIGRYNPYAAINPVPGDPNACAYYQYAHPQFNWHFMMLRVEPSGADQIVHAYHADTAAVCNTADAHGVVPATEVITMTHKAVGSDVCTLGTKIQDFSGAPKTSGKPCFVVNGAQYSGGFVYGYAYVDSLGVRIN